MEGFDKEWIFTDAKKRTATYTNLDPGEYVFKVKGSNNDGIWNEQGASIKIIIIPPWWRTNWAYFTYSIFILSVIYFTWLLQLKRIKTKQEFAMSRFEAKKLHEVDELKSRFFTNISHEFRTPLTLILGPSKQLSIELKDEKTKSKADLIHRSASKLNRLVDELLDISKIEAGEMKLKACPVNIVTLVSELAFSFHSLAERKKIAFNFNCDENEIIVYLDKDKADKILTNVLSNAFKFTPEGGKVEVAINCQAELVSASSVQHKIPKRVRDNNFVEISIRDTGVGIPADKLDKIFDRFFQVDGSHTREQEGTGIGLALTKELVDLHKGKILVESEEGKGSTFRIIFPLGKDHLEPEEICEDSAEKG
jgi:signal transduction histidine kinase